VLLLQQAPLLVLEKQCVLLNCMLLPAALTLWPLWLLLLWLLRLLLLLLLALQSTRCTRAPAAPLLSAGGLLGAGGLLLLLLVQRLLGWGDGCLFAGLPVVPAIAHKHLCVWSQVAECLEVDPVPG
jgi:hypothetical protein